MANLKLDLINKLNNEKFYAELELVRLAQEPNMNYKVKVDTMDALLGEIVTLNNKLALLEQYFKEPVAPQNTAPQNTTPDVPKAHQGQTHGE